MKSYRVYTMDAHGHISRAKDFTAVSDDDALRQVSEFEEPAGMELWQLDRLVKRFPPDPARAKRGS